MAKKVDVTFKNPVDETHIHHLELWRKTGAGGTFAQIGTDIAFVTGTANYSYEDLTASADGVQYFYEARAYNDNGGETDGVDYNKVEENITLSANVPANGITTISANNENINHLSLDWTNPVEVSFKIESAIPTSGKITGSNKNSNEAKGFNVNATLSGIRLEGFDTIQRNGAYISFATGDRIGFTYDGVSTFKLLKNGIIVDTLVLTTWDNSVSRIQVCGMATSYSNIGISDLRITEGIIEEIFNFSEQTGSTTTGDKGTVFDLTSNVSTEAMWTVF